MIWYHRHMTQYNVISYLRHDKISYDFISKTFSTIYIPYMTQYYDFTFQTSNIILPFRISDILHIHTAILREITTNRKACFVTIYSLLDQNSSFIIRPEFITACKLLYQSSSKYMLLDQSSSLHTDYWTRVHHNTNYWTPGQNII